MRESRRQNRRGTPTGERALRGARCPKGKRLRTASVGVPLPCSNFRSFVRAPCPIMMPLGPSTTEGLWRRSKYGVVFRNGLHIARVRRKSAPRERESICFAPWAPRFCFLVQFPFVCSCAVPIMMPPRHGVVFGNGLHIARVLTKSAPREQEFISSAPVGAQEHYLEIAIGKTASADELEAWNWLVDAVTASYAGGDT